MFRIISFQFIHRTSYKIPVYPCVQRKFSDKPPKNATEMMIKVLKTKFPTAKNIEVVDVSGGCGAMYEVLVESSDFKGLSIVKQHRLITETLQQQIKEMHGLRIHTIIPEVEDT